MTLSITYQELQQLAADKLHQNVELQSVGNNVLTATINTSIKKIVTINVQASAELKLSMQAKDLYVDYRILSIKNNKSALLSRLIDAASPNIVNVVLNHLSSKYPQYNDIVKKVPNADKLCIHLAAIPQLQGALQHVELESVVPSLYGLEIAVRLKN